MSSQNLVPDPDELSSLLAAIVESSDDAIISKTLDGIIVSWNLGAERIFGYSADETVGRPVTILIPKDRLREEPAILEQLRAGRRVDHFRTVRVRKDGTFVDISLTISPIRNASGSIVGASKIARDVTREAQAEEALRKVSSEREAALLAERSAREQAERLGRMKDEFLATVSHELRTPLNAILGWATLLARVKPGSDDYKRGVETIERNARLQSQLIADLLDMSAIVSGKARLDVQPLDLQEVVTAAIDSVRPSVDAKALRLRVTLDPRAGRMRGDPARLQQVFWNLLTNAVKFTPSGGRIDVVMERVNSHVEVSVEDSGMGIEPEFLPFVFDRFSQADSSATRRFGGLGLGLSITKHLVELHGGSVRVKSPGEGQGATFSVALPISVILHDETGRHDISAFSRSDLASIALPRLLGVRALAIDDEADARVLICRLIEGQGGECVVAGSAEEALRILATTTVSIIVSDIGMPDVDGYEFMQRFRTLHAKDAKKIPAIALTAYARPEDRQRALLAGYQMHIAKPVEPRELIAGIASLLNLTAAG